MIVAVTAVRVVQMPADQVVVVIAMGNGFVAATRSVLMPSVVTGAGMARCAGVGVGVAHRETVFVHVVLMRMMQVPVMQVVDVTVVLDRGVAAAGFVTMVVRVVDLVAHGVPL